VATKALAAFPRNVSLWKEHRRQSDWREYSGNKPRLNRFRKDSAIECDDDDCPVMLRSVLGNKKQSAANVSDCNGTGERPKCFGPVEVELKNVRQKGPLIIEREGERERAIRDGEVRAP
jgi:hypothetical protein